MAKYSETVEMTGHIIDSLILPKVLDDIIDAGADYNVLEFEMGRHHHDPSKARIQVSAADQDTLDEALRRIHTSGAVPVDPEDASLTPADRDGCLPEGFYSTTNLPTDVRLDGKWIAVENPEMDCGIVVKDGSARTLPMSLITSGDLVVTGQTGIRVAPLERPRGTSEFEFMGSDVSSEKPKALQVRSVAEEMKRTRKAGGKILWVVGPAVIHTGSGPDLAELVKDGWVDVLFAGNGFATHDIESNQFGTSLGVHLDRGTAAHMGHEHHIRTINRVRRAGSIHAAVEQGTITGGVMYQLSVNKVPFVLAGSVRDDGPLPDTVTDVLTAQAKMRALVPDVGLAIIVSSMLHGIGTGNMLPATVPTVCVDIDPSVVTKLLDRGTIQGVGVVTDAGLFIRQLKESLA